MRLLLLIAVTAVAIGVSCNRKDDTLTPTRTCNNGGPVMVDSGGTYFTLPSGFTPNGDGINDYWVAFTDNVDTADFSLTVSEGSTTHFTTNDPYFQWGPGEFIRQRKEFDVDVTFRARNGALIQACGKLTIPKQDSFFRCAENINGLLFADQVNIVNGKFEYGTGEEECP